MRNAVWPILVKHRFALALTVWILVPGVSHAQPIDPDCAVGVELENADIPKDGTFTLNLAGESPCSDSVCPVTFQPYQGDWNALVAPVVRMSWEFEENGPHKIKIQGIGDLNLPAGEEGEVLTSDSGSFLSASSVISALSENNGQLIVTNKNEYDLDDFSVTVVSETICPCFLKTEATKVIAWTNANGGDFWAGSNWNGGSPPARDSTAQFGLASTYTVSFSANAASDAMLVDGGGTVHLDAMSSQYRLVGPDCDNLSIRVEDAILEIVGGEVVAEERVVATGTGQGSILVSNSELTTKASAWFGTEMNSKGSLTVSTDAIATIPDAGLVGDLIFGAENTAEGTLVLEKGGVLHATRTLSLAGRPGSRGSAMVKNDSTRLDSELMAVGDQGMGSLIVRDSAKADATVLIVGNSNGATGDVTISDKGTTFVITEPGGGLEIGNSGVGTLTIEKHAEFDSGLTNRVKIGDEHTGVGMVVVRDSANWNGGIVQVGLEGSGEITLRDKATATFEALEVASGVGAASSGRVRVIGSGSSLEVRSAPRVWMGRAGAATFEIRDSASVLFSQALTMAARERAPASSPASATLLVTGSGSRLKLGTELVLGDSANATATVEQEAVLQATTAVGVGFRGDDTNLSRLEVTTRGLVETNVFLVGGGRGIVRIRSGGRINAINVIIGRDSTAEGNIQVEDPASVLDATNVIVGEDGHGILNTFSGGTAVIGTLTVNNGIVRGNMTVQNQAPIAIPKTASNDSTLGTILVDTLIINPGAVIEADTLSFGPDGVLGGAGVFPFDYVNRSLLSPGTGPEQPGVFTIDGSYEQTNDGSLRIELGGLEPGVEFDVLSVTGSAELGGVLRVFVLPGTEQPTGGETYRIVAADTIAGTFDAVEPQDGLEVSVDYGDREVTITVVAFTPVGIDGGRELPTATKLHQNFPNPFRSETGITFELSSPGHVRLSLYDILGRRKALLLDEPRSEGTHRVTLDGAELTSGLYFYQLETQDATLTKRLVIAR